MPRDKREKLQLQKGGTYTIRSTAGEPIKAGESKHGPWEMWPVECNGQSWVWFPSVHLRHLIGHYLEDMRPFTVHWGESGYEFEEPTALQKAVNTPMEEPPKPENAVINTSLPPISEILEDIFNVVIGAAHGNSQAIATVMPCAVDMWNKGHPLRSPEKILDLLDAEIIDCLTITELEKVAHRFGAHIRRLPDKQAAEAREIYAKRYEKIQKDDV